MAKIIIPTPLRKFTNNESTFDSNAKTVQSAVDDLVATYTSLEKHILKDDGSIRSFIRIYLGDEDINVLQKGQTSLNEDSVLSIVPAIAGGIPNIKNQ